MIHFWKTRSRFFRWFCSSLAVLLLTFCLGGGYLYYRLHTITLADIQKRHSLLPAAGAGASSSVDAAVPPLLANPIEKANQFASKPIQTQDALDVASILLKSGLSLSEIASLTGKADSHLSTEEKQRIRDLLLSKLSPDEIAALRSITSQYGKGLLILDPNYPIELVGVYDEAERARIQKELDARKAASGPTPAPSVAGTDGLTPFGTPGVSAASSQPLAGAAASSATPMPSKTPAAAANSGTAPSVQPSPTPTVTPSPAVTPSGTDVLLAPYQERLTSLQADCENEANGLLAEIKQALADAKGKGSTLSDVEVRYLAEVSQAEQRCDQKFNALLQEAGQALQQAGRDPKILDSWRQAYEARKNDLRLRAIQELSAEVKTSP